MENKRNQCKKCGGKGIPSKALRSYHNIRKSYLRGEVEFETKLVDCIKCENCGHSWIPSGMDPTDIASAAIMQKTDREKALEYWRKLSVPHKIMIWEKYKEKHFTPSINPEQLTGKEIENIWRKEFYSCSNCNQTFQNCECHISIKEKNKGLFQMHKIVPKILKEIKSNQKQFKKFEPELFKAYIDKFSEKDKIRAFEILYKNSKKWDGINNAAPFYMDICRAYNAGKKNQQDQHKAVYSNTGDIFRSSDEYFKKEFGF